VFEKSSDLKKSHTGDPTTFFKIQKKIGKIQENSIETGWRSRRNRKK
jgi:hypothetical protein